MRNLYFLKVFRLLILCSGLLFSKVVLSQDAWQDVGADDGQLSLSRGDYISIKFNGSTPYLSYRDWNNGFKATVRKLNSLGTSWEIVGMAGFTAAQADYVSMAFNGPTPYVAFSDRGNGGKVTVMRLNSSATAWETVGQVGFSAAPAHNTSIVFNGGVPYVTYSDQPFGGNVTIMRLNYEGTTWEYVGSPPVVGYSFSVAFKDSTPYVVFSDSNNGDRPTIMRLNSSGTNWELVGSPISVGSVYPSIAFDGSALYVLYTDFENGGKATVSRLHSSGTIWETVGNAGFSLGVAGYSSIVFNDSIPYVVYIDSMNFDEVTVKKLNSTGNAWETVGTGSLSGVPAVFPSIAFSSSVPWVAYATSSRAIKVKKLDISTQPTISSINRLSAGSGSTITITGSDFTGATAVSFGGIPASSFTVVSPTSITAVVGAGASGNVEVTTAGGSASISGFVFISGPPVISMISPETAGPAQSITISGSNFNPNPASNVVFIGNVRAAVNSATSNILSVTIPSGASYGHISVTNLDNNLTGYSSTAFSPAFSSDGITSFADKIDHDTPLYPHSVAAGDLDGDGKTDLVVANYGSNNISVYRNISAGSFSLSARTDIATGNGAIIVVLADLDGDGKKDAIVGNRTSGTVSLLKNISSPGTIAFDNKIDITTGSTSHALAVGDVDKDGKPDLVAGYSATQIAVYRNTSVGGSISFSGRTDLAIGNEPRSIAIDDIDGDNNPDIVVSSAGMNIAKISVLRNLSTVENLNFPEKADFTVQTALSFFIQKISISDLDGDGRNDIIVGSTSLAVFRNTSSVGAISMAPKIDLVGIAYGQAISDLNGDGKPDIVSANENSPPGAINVFLNNSTSGTMQFQFSRYSTGANTGSPAVVVADLDSDNRPDIAAVNNSGAVGANINKLSILRNILLPAPPAISSLSTYSAPAGTTLTISGSGFNTTAAQNLVKFGVAIAEVSSASSTSLSVIVPTGASYSPVSVLNKANKLTGFSSNAFSISFADSKNTINANDLDSRFDLTAGSFPSFLSIDDYDGDGKTDIAVPNQSGNNTSVFLNTSVTGAINSSSFTTSTNFPTANNPVNSITTDLDGDGKPEFVSANLTSNSLSVLRNTFLPGTLTTTSFDSKIDIPISGSPSFLKAADFNLDGKSDLAYLSGSTIVLLGNKVESAITAASFASPVSLIPAANPLFIATGDLNGDRKPDIVSSNSSNNTISLFSNTSTFSTISFSVKSDMGTGLAPGPITIGDLDGDGKAEVIVGNRSSSTISVFRNISNGGPVSSSSLEVKEDFPVSAFMQSLDLADINGDGKPDIITVLGNNVFAILRNTSTAGDISFAAPVEFPASPGAKTVASGDVDGDGKPDLIIANTNGTVSIIHNSPKIEAAPQISSFSPSSGFIGSLVTINGNNLDNLSSFEIGGKPAITISKSDTKLVGMVMPDALTGSIGLTNSVGSTSSAANFTIGTPILPNTQQGAKLADATALEAAQGNVVAISADGNTLVVGGPQDGSEIGALWVYVRNESGIWTQQGNKLTGTGGTGLPGLGSSVAISADGNTIISGGIYDNTSRGAAWIFIRNNNVWSQQGGKLVGAGSTSGAWFGSSVSLSADGNTAIIGARRDNSEIGAAWIYKRNISGVWIQSGSKLIGTGAVGTAQQGVSVAMSGDGNTALVGGFNDNGYKGAVWVYTRSGQTWMQQGTKLVGTGSTVEAKQGSGVALSLDGNTALIGAAVDDSESGSAFIFTRTNGVWSQHGNKLTAMGGVGSANFGDAVSLSGDGSTAFIGAPDDDGNGGAWIFKNLNGVWTQQGSKLFGQSTSEDMEQGISVSLSADGTTAVFGGPEDNGATGAAWVFTGLDVVSPTFAITSASNLTQSSATLAGSIISDGGSAITERGFVYGLTPNPTLINSSIQSGTGAGSFSQSISGLYPGTTYYARAYAINAVGTTYGTEAVFTTMSLFPYNESFRNITASNMIYGGTPVAATLTAASAGDANGAGYLRLTTAGANQNGFARNSTAFPTANGLSISFEYYTYGGSGGDGLSFFLYDASANSSFQIGAAGGSLGYAQTSNSGGLAGVSKGYLGIGLDEFGNFSNPTAGRQGGPGLKSSSITLRGDGNGAATIPSNYEYLTGIQTTNATAMNAAGAGNTFAIAGMVNGRTGNIMGRPQGGLLAQETGYRKLKIDLVPNGLGTGFLLNAWITEGSAGLSKVHKVINNYSYIGSTLPEFLSYGFVASTGGSNNVHEVRNLSILVPEGSSLAPSVAAVSKSGASNTIVPFSALNFSEKFSSPTGDSLQKIKITSLPLNGILKHNSMDVIINQEININELVNMTFAPSLGFTGSTSFEWNGSDGNNYASASASVEINITAPGLSLMPYSESFKNSSASNMVYGGTALAVLTASQGTDAEGAGYLRLTSNTSNQNGFARNTSAFPTDQGLNISFEYFTHTGSGGDGFSFFLYDAAANGAFQIGAPGGSLGYAQNTSVGGVSKGYLGFGFDTFGNFSSGIAGRQGGPGTRQSSLTIRGDGNGTGAGSPAGSNYEFVSNIQTTNLIQMTALNAGPTFTINGNVNGRTVSGDGLTVNHSGYRKAQIELLPNGQGTGFVMNVWITEGNTSGGVIHHIVKNHSYVGSNLPSTLSYGFVGSTGGVNNIHEIRNMEIRVPGAIPLQTLMALKGGEFGDMKSNLAQVDNTDLVSASKSPNATNLITPNGDGKNDVWVIRNINDFPGNSVKIFDRTGKIVYNSNSYGNDWDGSDRGVPLRSDTYYYVLDLGKGGRPITGYISILR